MEQEDTDDILPSPLDPTMRALDIADLVSIGAALYCGWQLGEWWGIGLAVALVAGNFFNAYRSSLYRDELMQDIQRLAFLIVK